MDRAQALKCLGSDNPHERLLAARALGRCATADDRYALRQYLKREETHWVKAALERAIQHCEGIVSAEEPVGDAGMEIELSDPQSEIYSSALEQVTRQLLHELEPAFGLIKYHAEKEFPHYGESNTRQQIEHFDALLDAIGKLNRAAGPARIEELDLADLISSVSFTAVGEVDQNIAMVGRAPMLAFGDRALIELIVSNGLRNAVEATREVERSEGVRQIVVSWGKTDRDYWVTILDKGVGLVGSARHAFEIGSTTKSGHLGMGLALSKRAAVSMNGSLNLTSDSRTGTQLEFRWPQYSKRP